MVAGSCSSSKCSANRMAWKSKRKKIYKTKRAVKGTNVAIFEKVTGITTKIKTGSSERLERKRRDVSWLRHVTSHATILQPLRPLFFPSVEKTAPLLLYLSSFRLPPPPPSSRSFPCLDSANKQVEQPSIFSWISVHGKVNTSEKCRSLNGSTFSAKSGVGEGGVGEARDKSGWGKTGKRDNKDGKLVDEFCVRKLFSSFAITLK